MADISKIELTTIFLPSYKFNLFHKITSLFQYDYMESKTNFNDTNEHGTLLSLLIIRNNPFGSHTLKASFFI